MIEVSTGCRLHAGLLRPPPPVWDGPTDAPVCGGVGWMADAPGYRIRFTVADVWSATGPQGDAALAIARRYAATLREGRPLALEVVSAIPEHAGLGSGTQRALAVATGVRAALGLSAVPVEELAVAVGRGLRSAVGLHGFARGGFLVDGGKRSPGEAGALRARLDWPAEWALVLVFGDPTDWHGDRERAAFREAVRDRPDVSERLERLLEGALMPAVRAGDHPAFAAALHEYNALAGEPFRAAQGGTYSSPAVAATVARLRASGAAGAGQSSWGPTAFAVLSDADRAAWVAARAGGVVTRLRTEGVAVRCEVSNGTDR